jgi:RNA polymerase sigma-70 factor, ECF subfamily
VTDLELARACLRGDEAAWRELVETYRPILYAAARRIAGDESSAREIADSLWADLYGIRESAGERRSLLAYFHGRSSLATWLRALVARRHVDRWRETKRTESLDAREERSPEAAPSGDPAAGDPDRRRLLELFRRALAAVLAALDPRDRLRLAAHHLDGRTLAEIGRALGEHESTVSRKLERTRTRIRRDVERELRRAHGLGNEEIAACYEHATADWPFSIDLEPPAEARVPGRAARGSGGEHAL